jgi:lipoyl(octanoyl) transferase
VNDPRLHIDLLPRPATSAPVEWRVSKAQVPYEQALEVMEARAAAIAAGEAAELVWLLEHPPLYTAGTGSRTEDLIGSERFPLYTAGRGGKLTYHGPGQRVAYVMLDLRARGKDVRRFVASLEEWLIRTLARFGVTAERRADRIGVWVQRPEQGEGREDKIAALGIRVKKWVSLHGISLNVAPDLTHYQGILPCGVSEQQWGVTSLADLGVKATLAEVDAALRASFEEIFGPVTLGERAHQIT